SPEQVRGEPVDSRSDVFAAGAILHELLTGHRAFSGASVIESGHAILHEEPEPLPASIPAPLARIVSRCLAKDPNQRFQSARDLAFALEAIHGATEVIPRSNGRRVARIRWQLVGTAVLLALLSASFLAGRGEKLGRAPDIRVLTFRRGSILSARFAPDGKTVRYSAAWNGAALQVYSTTVSVPEPHPLGFRDAHLLAVSPSGELALSLHPRLVRFDGFAQGTLARVSPMGGVPRELTTNVEYADWAPDGERLAVVRNEKGRSQLEFPLGRIVFVSPGGGEMSHPRVAPDGQRVAFIHHPFPSNTDGEVMVVDSAGATETWSPRFDTVLGLAWMPDGKELLASGALKAPLDGLWALRPGRAPRRVYSAPGAILLTDVSPDRRVLMVQTDWRQEVEVRTEGQPSQALEWLEWGLLAGISDDGRKVLFFEFGRGAAGGSIPGMLLLRDSRENEPVILGRGRGLALSPDGRWALAATDSRTLILLPTGPGESRKLSIPLARIQRAAFFRDGARLALVGWSTSEGRSGLFLYDMNTGDCRPISPDPVANLSVFVSFDQRHVAVSDTEGNIKAYALDGSVTFRVPAWTDNFQLAGWLQDGSLLAFDRTAVPARVERYDPRTGAVTLFTTLGPSDAAGVTGIGRAAVTPDGRTIAYQLRRMSGVLSVLDWGDAPP
ncbi:MAG TPA: protein kinase family protein, partial [Myxococcaceae bacterium]|nr:protein kinase family protein [Myxococcaceae bacterium]